MNYLGHIGRGVASTVVAIGKAPGKAFDAASRKVTNVVRARQYASSQNASTRERHNEYVRLENKHRQGFKAVNPVDIEAPSNKGTWEVVGERKEEAAWQHEVPPTEIVNSAASSDVEAHHFDSDRGSSASQAAGPPDYDFGVPGCDGLDLHQMRAQSIFAHLEVDDPKQLAFILKVVRGDRLKAADLKGVELRLITFLHEKNVSIDPFNAKFLHIFLSLYRDTSKIVWRGLVDRYREVLEGVMEGHLERSSIRQLNEEQLRLYMRFADTVNHYDLFAQLQGEHRRRQRKEALALVTGFACRLIFGDFSDLRRFGAAMHKPCDPPRGWDS